MLQGKTRKLCTPSAKIDAAILPVHNATERMIRQDISQRPSHLRSIYDNIDASPARDVVTQDELDGDSEKHYMEDTLGQSLGFETTAAVNYD